MRLVIASYVASGGAYREAIDVLSNSGKNIIAREEALRAFNLRIYDTRFIVRVSVPQSTEILRELASFS